VKSRNAIGARYTELLKDVCAVPVVDEGNTHVYAQYTIRVADRDQLADKLKEAGIPNAIYYPKCLHEQPVFEPLGYEWGSLPEAEKASREVISLPMHPFLSDEDQDKVVDAVKKALA
jgi:UDP-2-acetamido-2-deoxy-ribo-hexuluronate aminotransferase